jgi:spermidine synthase
MSKPSPQPPPAPAGGNALLYTAVFFINFLSLACQVIWLRKLTYLFGTTAAVFSTVLAVFLLGLALGARSAGRWSDLHGGQGRRPGARHADATTPLWRALGRLVIGLGLFVLLSLPLFNLGRSLYLAALPGDLAPLAAALGRLLITLVCLLPPTAAIGAVFPLAVRLAGRSYESLGRDLSRLYGLDTLGAAAGALAAGFLLVPLLGLTASTRVLGVGALALGVVLLLRASRQEGGKSPRRSAQDARGSNPPRQEASPATGADAPRTRALLAAFFATGAGALLLEAGWNRYFALLNGTHVYSTSAVLAGFLLGIGLGSLLMASRIDRLRNPHGVVAALFAVVALGGLAVFHSAGIFTRFYFGLFHATSSYVPFQMAVCAGIAVLVFLATLAMGANFPLVARLLTSNLEERGEAAGRAFFVNTLGGVAGAFAAEFVVLPAWGFTGLALLALALYAGAAFAVLAGAPRERRRPALATTGCALLAALLWSPPFTPLLVPVHALYYHGLRLGSLAAFDREVRRLKVIEARQGFYGQVAAVSLPPYLLLKNNGKTDSSSSPADNRTQILLGHLPIFFNADPGRVLIIGLGGGFTLQAVERHTEPREITVVEIDPLVVDLARRRFGAVNGHALDDRRVKVVTNDGRNYLESSPRQYDVISSEPPNLWVAGVSGLFTQEFYRAAAAHLAPGGVLCQWVPLYEMGKEDFRVMLHTLTSVFPSVTFWQLGSDVVFLASKDPLTADYETVMGRLRRPGVRASLTAIGLTEENTVMLLNNPVVEPAQVAAFLGRIDTLNTDDLPVLEFSTARNLYTLPKEARAAPRASPPQR